jgi:putative hydrolase of the HAD superfamily
MPIRAVLFDAVGTLIYADPRVAAVYAEVGHRFGSALDEGMIGERFCQALAVEDEIDRTVHRLRTDPARERDRWRRIVATVFSDLADTASVFDELWRHFASPASWRVYGDVPACLELLGDTGITVGIASNFDDRLHAIVNALAPLGRCQQVFVSSQIGWRKPAIGFFRAIEQRLGVASDEHLLVGDDWENDCLAATSAGWQAVFVDRKGRKTERRSASIRSLSEL